MSSYLGTVVGGRGGGIIDFCFVCVWRGLWAY